MNNKKHGKIDKQKLDKALKAAQKSGEYLNDKSESMIDTSLKASRRFNNFLDRIFLNKKYIKFLSLFIAIVLFININNATDISIHGQSDTGMVYNDVTINYLYDKDKYVIITNNTKVNMSLIGSLDAIRRTKNSGKYEVFVDLSNAGVGRHKDVGLSYSGIAKGVEVMFSTPTVTVDIYDRISREFDLKYELVNTENSDIRNINKISLDINKVTIKSSTDILDRVVTVKALIDVKNKNESFVLNEAKIVAYDKNGEIISNIIIEPSSVKATITFK